MKIEQITHAPDTRDLERALWLSPLPPATRSATITSLREMVDAFGADNVLGVKEIEEILADLTVARRNRLGKRSSQILSDARRAIRIWSDESTRWLATTLRGRLPTLRDAQMASGLSMNKDEASRATKAIDALAAHLQDSPEDITATEQTVGPILAGLSPESFGVATTKSLANKRSLVLRAVRLVAPTSRVVRIADLKALPQDWRRQLELASSVLAQHETSAAAILKRFSIFAHRLGVGLEDVSGPLALSFYAQERATRSDSHEEKLRRAVRAWNDVSADGVPLLPSVHVPRHRQVEVAWKTVPAAIRAPLDEILDCAVSAKADCDWSDLVADDGDQEYAELGLAPDNPDTTVDGLNVIELGTRKNWRDAVKRAWYAASKDPRVAPKPTRLEDLFTVSIGRALVAATRAARRDRLEAEGGTFNPKEKGRYEHSLVEALCSVGRRVIADLDCLEPLEEFKRDIDPAVVGTKLVPEGKKRIYADRRIGPRHAKLLAGYADESRMRRYLEAPSLLWRLACAPLSKGKVPTRTHVALARSALFLRIAQYVGPLRRSNLVRLRYAGEDPHLILPEGNGEGTLRIPASETKTLTEIHVQIDRETVKMLKKYLSAFLPHARVQNKSRKDNPHLFPGSAGKEPENGGYDVGMGYVTKTKANSTFRKQLWRHSKVHLCLHVMRHLAGKIILDMDPSAMSLVQTLLGHKTIETTRSYYAEVCSIVAQRRYLHLLEKTQRQVLAKITYTFVEV